MTTRRLDGLIGSFADARIAVVGDFFLDRYLDIDPGLEETSVETGLPAHQVSGIRCSPGAAGTVISNLAALSAGQLHAIGFSGDDGEGWELRRALERLGCTTTHLHTAAERHTPTYTKPRDVTTPGLRGEHSRLDTKNRQPTPAHVEEAILGSLHRLVDDVDAVVVLDQVEARNCGAVTDRVRDAIAEIAVDHSDVVFWADSRRRIREFQGVITKPNQFELIDDSDPTPGAAVDLNLLHTAAIELRESTNAPVVVTRGAAGMCVTDPEWTHVPGVRLSGETDTTGAGDSATAGCVLALCGGANLVEAVVVGNLVASVTVEQLAMTGTARPDQLTPRLRRWLTES